MSKIVNFTLLYLALISGVRKIYDFFYHFLTNNLTELTWILNFLTFQAGGAFNFYLLSDMTDCHKFEFFSIHSLHIVLVIVNFVSVFGACCPISCKAGDYRIPIACIVSINLTNC